MAQTKVTETYLPSLLQLALHVTQGSIVVQFVHFPFIMLL